MDSTVDTRPRIARCRVPKWLRDQGYLISDGTWKRLASPSSGLAPPVDEWIGRHAYYLPENLLGWWRSRGREKQWQKAA